jgi:von Willebrand factor A domain-containing protein 8
MKLLAPNIPTQTLERIVSAGMVLRSENDASSSVSSVAIPMFPSSLENIAHILHLMPDCNLRFLFDLSYPYPLLNSTEPEQKSIIESVYQRFDIVDDSTVSSDSNKPTSDSKPPNNPSTMANSGYEITSIRDHTQGQDRNKIQLHLTHPRSNTTVALKIPAGPYTSSKPDHFIQTDYHSRLLTTLLQIHASNHDILLVGPKGVGKSALVRAFSSLTGNPTTYIPLHKDLSTRDLLARRSTTPNGSDTLWELSPLVLAAIQGSLAVLDPVDVLVSGTLASLVRLVREREVALPDGSVLLRHDVYDSLMSTSSSSSSPSSLNQNEDAPKLRRVHPSFRIICVGRPTVPSATAGRRNAWMSAEILHLFDWVTMRALMFQEECLVVGSVTPGIDMGVLKVLLGFADAVRRDADETVRSLASALSTR